MNFMAKMPFGMRSLLIHQIKKIAAPTMLIHAPTTCCAVIFSLNMIAEGMMIMMGANAIRAEATPVCVR